MHVAWRSETAARPADDAFVAASHRRLLLVGVASLALLAMACRGGSEEADVDPPTVAAAAAASGVSTATPGPTTPPTPSAEDEAVASWGQHVCEVTSTFSLEFLDTGDPRDPDELELEPRKERAAAMFPAQQAAVRAATDALEGVEPPKRTRELHELLLATYRDLDEALHEQEQIIANATTTEEIEASNELVDELIDLAFRQATLLWNAGYCQ